MSAIPSPGRVEAALQRMVERPFLRRAPLDLPLLKASLKRAMADELKPVAPSRFVLAVPAEQFSRLGSTVREWEEQLAEYLLEVVEENGWSAVDHPRIQILPDPQLRGNTVMVSVDEGYLVRHGRTLRQKKRREVLVPFLASMGAMMASLYMFVLLVTPGMVPAWLPSLRLPTAGAVPTPPGDRPLALPPLAAWWDNARDIVTEAASGTIKSAVRVLREAVPRRVTGEVGVSPGLNVRAGSPSRTGGVSPSGFLPEGTVLHWWSFQVARGESIAGEDRWVEIGRAGPEWGDRVGEKLYVWMGGLRVR